MYFHKFFLFFIFSYSILAQKDSILWFKNKKPIKGKVEYIKNLYHVTYGGTTQSFNRSDLLGITSPRPKKIVKLESLSIAEIVKNASDILLDEETIVWGWSVYCRFVYAMALVLNKDYSYALDISQDLDNTLLGRSNKLSKVDRTLLKLVKLEIDIDKKKNLEYSSQFAELDKIKHFIVVENYISYLKGRFFTKKGEMNKAIINYLKVVFLEKDVTLYKVESIRNIIKIYEENHDPRIKIFQKLLKKLTLN